MAVSCYISGRTGNAFFSIAQMLAHAKQYNLDYIIPKHAIAYREHAGHVNNPFSYIPSTANTFTTNPSIFEEADIHTQPSYQLIPKLDNVIFTGYFQSFLYFDQHRDFIIQKFRLPNVLEKGITAIHIRRGDCIGSTNFPILALDYYQNAVKYMQNKGFNKFKVYSDDILWCKRHFVMSNFPEANFEFSSNKTEMEDYKGIAQSENVITARSTFSLTAAWLNQNPNKLVLVPSDEKFPWFKGQNKDLLTGTGFIKIDFDKIEDLQLERQY